MSLGKRLAEAFRLADTSAPEVARVTGVSASSINALIRRDSGRSGLIEPILAALPADKVNIDWVRTGRGPASPGDGTKPTTTTPHTGTKKGTETGLPAVHLAWEAKTSLPIGEWVLVPRLLVTDAAEAADGYRIVLLREESQVFRTDWIVQDALFAPALGWETKVDDSMEPVIWKGDNYVVDTTDATVEDGATYCIFYGGKQRVRRLFALPGGGLRLSPNNPRYETIDIADARAIRVIGRVVRKSGRGGLK